MNPGKLSIVVAACAGLLLSAATVLAADKVNYEDHLLPLLRNECTSCHNPDKKKAGLDLSSYTAMMAGSDNGTVVNPGDPDASLLYKVVTHTEDPYMPKGKGKLADKDLEIFKAFITGGAPENASGKAAIVKARPKLNLSVAANDTGKPVGPPPMPHDLVLEPVIHTTRPGALMCLAASPWAPLVAVGGQHQVLLYNTDSLELLGVLPWNDGDPYVAKFSRNGAVLMVGGGVAAKSGHVILFDVATGKRITQIGDEFDAVIAADISPDQSSVAMGGPGRTLKVYSTDGQPLHAIKKHTDWITAISYSPDGVLLASGDRQGALWVWEAKSGHEFYGLTGHKGAITDLCFRGDSNILASASEDGSVKLWDMQSGKEVKSFNAHNGGVLSVSFAHDGSIVTSGRDKNAHVWKPDGSSQAVTDAFTDIALHAAFDGGGKRIVAGDWTGSIRVFDAATAKPVGELSADPPVLADRLTAATGRLPDLQSASDKAAGELAAAQQASDKAAGNLQAANLADAEAKKAVDQTRSQEKALADSLQAARVESKAADENANVKQADANRLGQAAGAAVAARDTADREKRALADASAAKQKVSEDANRASDKAKADAEKTPDNAQLASAARDAKNAADHLAQEFTDAQKALGMKGDQLAMLTDQAAKAQAEADHAKTAASAARDTATAKQTAVQKQQNDHQLAADAMNKAQQTSQNAAQQIAPRTQEAKNAAEQVARVKPLAEQAAAQLAAGKLEIAKLRAAQFNLTVWAARDELAARQAALEKLTGAVQDSRVAADKAAADLALAQKSLADGPARIKAREDAVAKAKDAMTAAVAARDATQAALTERQALVAQSTDVLQKLTAVAAKTPDDKALADSVAKSKAALDALNAAGEPLKAAVAAKSDAVQQAQMMVAAAEAALVKEKSDIDAAPKMMEAMKSAAQAAQNELPQKQAAADEESKAVTAAKTRADDLAAQYKLLSQEATMPPAADAKPKG